MKAMDFLKKVLQEEKTRACMDIALNSLDFAQQRTFSHFEKLFADYDTAKALTSKVYDSITDEDIEEAKEVLKSIALLKKI